MRDTYCTASSYPPTTCILHVKYAPNSSSYAAMICWCVRYTVDTVGRYTVEACPGLCPDNNDGEDAEEDEGDEGDEEEADDDEEEKGNVAALRRAGGSLEHRTLGSSSLPFRTCTSIDDSSSGMRWLGGASLEQGMTTTFPIAAHCRSTSFTLRLSACSNSCRLRLAARASDRQRGAMWGNDGGHWG
jgi:hypothetical protein